LKYKRNDSVAFVVFGVVDAEAHIIVGGY